MTHKTPAATTAKIDTPRVVRALSLSAAIQNHQQIEKASFHTPGHKGRGSSFDWSASDLTELPGLDELGSPCGVIDSLQARTGRIWQAHRSYISVNGASAALCAALLACGQAPILLPRNLHRSAVSALVMSGADPIWYEPEWDKQWNFWGEVRSDSIKATLDSCKKMPAAVLVTSPTYPGRLSAIEDISRVCKDRGVLLIVDEAHGAHLVFTDQHRLSALRSGADIVIHSLHKTLSAPTQTGLLQISSSCTLSNERLQAALNLLQSSSPSYALMRGVEAACDAVENGGEIEAATRLARQLRQRLSKVEGLQVYDGYNGDVDALHVLIRMDGISADQLYQELANRGVFAEAILGNGVLLLLGTGSRWEDCEELLAALNEVPREKTSSTNVASPACKPSGGEQVLNPRQAFFMPSEEVPMKEAIGRIASDWFAPCPPGWPLLIPGQRISHDISFISPPTERFRVVVDS